jgi:hypothetical protein
MDLHNSCGDPSTLKNYQTSINFNQINSKENLIIRKLEIIVSCNNNKHHIKINLCTYKVFKYTHIQSYFNRNKDKISSPSPNLLRENFFLHLYFREEKCPTLVLPNRTIPTRISIYRLNSHSLVY